MLSSQLLLDILDLSMDHAKQEQLLRQQVPFLAESYVEHTKVGLYVYLSHEEGIAPFQISIQARYIDPQGDATDDLGELEMENETLNIDANVIVHLKNGYIDCIEFWNRNGEDFPHAGPASYLLKSNWKDTTKNRTIRR